MLILTFGACPQCGAITRITSTEQRVILDNDHGHEQWHADQDSRIAQAADTAAAAARTVEQAIQAITTAARDRSNGAYARARVAV